MSMIDTQPLASGEQVALAALEIVSIPHVSVIDGEATADEVVRRYQQEFARLLGEVYQAYREASSACGFARDWALELLWKTVPVENQPYNAQIKLFLVVRAIDAQAAGAAEAAERVLKLCRSTLALQKYGDREFDARELAQQVAAIHDGQVRAIVKGESAEFLQNNLLPYCYSYDKLSLTGHDFSRIIGALTEYPDCAVSMQLMPAVFSNEEIKEMENILLILDTLRNGISDQKLGTVSFALAEKYADIYKYYSKNKFAPLFTYNMLVYGDQPAAANIASRLYGQLSSGEEEPINLQIVELGSSQLNKDRNLYPMPWAVNELLLNASRNQSIWISGQFPAALYRLPYIITAEEASEFFRLPVGSGRVAAGLQVEESQVGSKTYGSKIINAGDLVVGKLRSSPREDHIGFALKDLSKHMLVVGTPGSGKTTFCVSLLDRLWKQHGIPFLVIEPAKTEYRALIQSIPDLQVFTPGKNFISPFVFNPFVPPKNVKLETYKSTLKTAFAAAVSMSTPLDKIFEEAINNCYSDFRWLDTYTSDDKGRIFNIADFIRCFQKTFDDIGYTGDARNIGRAGVVRLNSLSNLFDNYFSIPIEDILKKPTVIELAAIENSDQKALIIALLLLSVLAYVNANYIGSGGLKNVILLEEAHVLLDADTNLRQGDANPSAIAQGLVKRMLAEIRAYGVGLLIADQSPRKVSADVVALTDIKMAFRLVESEDKQMIADSTGMSEVQVQRLARLKPGEAFLFFNKLDEPEEVITPDYRLENKIDITLSDEAISQLSTYWKDKPQALRPYPQCGYCAACTHGCDFHRRILAREVARRIFVAHFKQDSNDFEIVKKVFSQISHLTRAELNDEPFTKELLNCVKLHLWRRIRYGTKIDIKEIQIENSLKK